jgi:hypothetical protein
LRALAAALLCLPAVAAANGRSAAVLSIAARAGAPSDLLLGTTFGTLVSRDGGASWRWFCERVALYTSEPPYRDPAWRWLAGGAIVATTEQGLAVSRDGGCSFGLAAGTEGAVAVELDPSEPSRVWLVAASGLLESTDAAASFTLRLARPVAGVAVAPSDPRHLYLKTLDRTLLHSPDGGATWDEHRFEARADYRLAAVDPGNAATLYVIVSEPDALLRSVDGGRSFAPVRETRGPIEAVAFFGGRLWVYDLGEGMARSAETGFETVAGAPRATCLAAAGERLLACANYQLDRHVLAATSGDGFTPLVTWFSEVRGPIACAPGTPSSQICEPEWTVLGPQFFPQADAAPADAAPLSPPQRSSGCSAGAGAVLALVLLRKPRR